MAAIGVGGGLAVVGAGMWPLASTIMSVPPSQLVVTVGLPGELSGFETSEGQTVITTQPGRNAAGYSGMGSGSSCSPCYDGDGGEDGGDGGDAPGCSNCYGVQAQVSKSPPSPPSLLLLGV